MLASATRMLKKGFTSTMVSQRSNTIILTVVLLVQVSCGEPAVERPPAASHTNLLLITLDTTRQDRLGAYGSNRGLTPNIDRLAADGAVFIDARSQVPITLPSHTTIHTGLGLLEHGVRENGNFALPESATTLAERLVEAGYQTAAFVSAFVLDRRFGLAQGFDHYDDEMAMGDWGSWKGHDVGLFERDSRKTTERAIAWLEQHRGGERPFFMWVHLFDPHEPWAPPQEWQNRADNLYDGEIGYMDHHVGQLLNDLKTSGLESRTVIAVASDHGENMEGPGQKAGHGWDINEPAMRAVLILRHPDTVPARRRIEGTVGLRHLASTLVDLLGLDHEVFPGETLRPLLGGAANLHATKPFYMETLLPTVRRGRPDIRGLLEGRWKLVHTPRGGQSRLYDIVEDPDEQEDLSANNREQTSAMVSRLNRTILDAKATTNLKMLQMDEETRKKLEALGYL